MSVYGLHSVHAHISVSRLPTCPGKKWKKKFPVNGLRTEEQSKTEQNKTKQKKRRKKSNGTRVYKSQVPLEKTKPNKATSRTEQSI